MINQYKKKKASSHKMGEVVSVVSHQLKTPLSGVKGYLEVLLSDDLGKLNPQQKEYLQYTLNNVNRMIELVKDLLDVSRIEQNRIEFNPQPSDLAKIIQETIEDFSSLARAKNCAISFKIFDRTPILMVDSMKIKQVVTNIIFNAIEYNRGKEKIEITLKKERNRIIFCCKDEGIGISEDEKKKIFTKFFRSERAITLTTGGSGLGLFISKAIIEKSGGKIWFKSKKDKGSTFYFSLPYQK